MPTSENLNTAGEGGQETTAAKAFIKAIWEIVEFGHAVTANTRLLREKKLAYNKKAVGHILFELSICRLIDICLTYVSDALRLVYSRNPNAIPESKQMIAVKSIFQFDSMEELRAELLDQKVRSLSFKSLEALDQYLLKNLNVSLFPDESSKRIACFLVDWRNLIVHNAGIVNRKFQEKYPESSIGRRVELGGKKDAAHFMLDWIIDLDVRLTQKFDLPTEPRVAVSLPESIKMFAE